MRVVALLLVVAGCSKSGEPANEAAGASTGRPRVLAAWKDAGLEPAGLTAESVAFGSDCQRGSVSGVDVLLCQYHSASAAKEAERASLAWVGDTTGAAWATGDVVIAVADRTRADPAGKTINRLMKLAPR